MCSFVQVKCKQDRVDEVLPTLIQILKIKGGDEYNFVVKFGQFSSRINWADILEIMSQSDNDNLALAIGELINDKVADKLYGKNLEILGFSRLTPEMENVNNTMAQPYYNVTNDAFVVVHGTIPNAEEIAAENNIHIDVDTDLFNYLPFEYVCTKADEMGGKISAIKLDYNNNISHYHNGLGLYDVQYNGAHRFNITTNIDVRNTKILAQWVKTYKANEDELDPYQVISLYSGGLDITCATQRVLYDLHKANKLIETVDLWYFDWNTVAAESEKAAGRKAANFLNDELNECVDFTEIKVDSMFKNILDNCDIQNTRLTDTEAVGAGTHEAEAAISYVPYRNTFLLTMAAAKAEQMYPNKKCIFIIGANLSEGMVYLDNSETWLTGINQLIKVGGQKSIHFEVVAPYVNRTKTEMVKDAIDKDFELDSSFSCYFPVDGKPCGACGSCLLRENALIRGKRI